MNNDLVSRQTILALPRRITRTLGGDIVEESVDIEDIKKLPSAQPSEIQDILEYLDTVLHPIISPDHWNVYSELHDMVSMLPSAQPAQRWIPCSERMPDHPENNDYYLVTIQCEHYDGWDDYVTGFAEWTKHGWDVISCYIGQIKVVAWMPLPEPYQEEEPECANGCLYGWHSIECEHCTLKDKQRGGK